jgi:hypothetical protein
LRGSLLLTRRNDVTGRTPALGQYLALTGVGSERAAHQSNSANQKKKDGLPYGHGCFSISFWRGNIDPDQGRAKPLVLDCNKRQTRKNKMGGIAPVQSHICPCCGSVLKQPEWSERVSDEQTAYVWRCANCSYYSETRDKSASVTSHAAEQTEEFLPKLVVV